MYPDFFSGNSVQCNQRTIFCQHIHDRINNDGIEIEWTRAEAGLVTDRREGRWAYYSLVPDALAEAHDVVRALASERPARGRASLRVLGSCCG